MKLHEKKMALQTKVAELIESIPEFNGYTVTTESRGDLSKQIQQSLSKMSLAIIAITPESRVVKTFAGRVIREIAIQVGIYETPILNRSDKTRLTALHAADLIAENLHNAENGFEADAFDDEATGRFMLQEGQPDVSLYEDEKTKQLIYYVTLITQL